MFAKRLPKTPPEANGEEDVLAAAVERAVALSVADASAFRRASAAILGRRPANSCFTTKF